GMLRDDCDLNHTREYTAIKSHFALFFAVNPNRKILKHCFHAPFAPQPTKPGAHTGGCLRNTPGREGSVNVPRSFNRVERPDIRVISLSYFGLRLWPWSRTLFVWSGRSLIAVVVRFQGQPQGCQG